MLPPETPVRPSVFIPRARAVYRALRTLPEFPEVLMAQSKSLAFPYPQTCWAKTYSGPMSLEIAVHRAVCAHKETARIPSCSFAPKLSCPGKSLSASARGLGNTKDFINSPTI